MAFFEHSSVFEKTKYISFMYKSRIIRMNRLFKKYVKIVKYVIYRTESSIMTLQVLLVIELIRAP